MWKVINYFLYKTNIMTCVLLVFYIEKDYNQEALMEIYSCSTNMNHISDSDIYREYYFSKRMIDTHFLEESTSIYHMVCSSSRSHNDLESILNM